MTDGDSRRRSNVGTFVISLDTELSWGSFDKNGLDSHVEAYQNTRGVVCSLCELFDEYEMPATWALVMHLLDDCSGHEADPSPTFDWIDDWYGEAPCSTNVEKELWYAPDILDEIRASQVHHEIGLHGYSHVILGASGCSSEVAAAEVEKAVSIANEIGFEPETYVFPRNQIGHLEVLRENGIEFYRGVDARWYERTVPELLRKPLRFSDEFLRRTPPVVSPRVQDGLIEVPGSQILRPSYGPWGWTPSDSQVDRAIKGLDRAAKTGRIYHLWFHPFNLALEEERHLRMLERILSHAAALRDEGRITVQPIRTCVDVK